MGATITSSITVVLESGDMGRFSSEVESSNEDFQVRNQLSEERFHYKWHHVNGHSIYSIQMRINICKVCLGKKNSFPLDAQSQK